MMQGMNAATQLRQNNFSMLSGNIYAELDRLAHAVGNLANKIAVTLTPERPTCDINKKGENVPVLSEFEAGMNDIGRRVQDLAIRVEDLIDRCSL